jgi:hypothetical protein
LSLRPQEGLSWLLVDCCQCGCGALENSQRACGTTDIGAGSATADSCEIHVSSTAVDGCNEMSSSTNVGQNTCPHAIADVTINPVLAETARAARTMWHSGATAVSFKADITGRSRMDDEHVGRGNQVFNSSCVEMRPVSYRNERVKGTAEMEWFVERGSCQKDRRDSPPGIISLGDVAELRTHALRLRYLREAEDMPRLLPP